VLKYYVREVKNMCISKEQQGHMKLCVTEQLLHVLTSNMTGIP